MPLIIDDAPGTGVPVWANPNIWVSDLPPGVPLGDTTQVANPNVNGEYLMKGNIHNTSQVMESGFLHWYWANPSTAITVASANPVGPPIAITISAGATRVRSSSDAAAADHFFPPPLSVNGGHICMIVAITPMSTSPASLDPNLPNVAQRNLNLIEVAPKMMMFQMGFEMASPDEEPDKYNLEMVQAAPDDLRLLLKAFALDLPLQSVEGKIQNFGVIDFTPCVEQRQLRRARPLLEGVKLKPYQRRGLTLAGILEGDAALIHVTQFRDNREIIGGISVIVYRNNQQKIVRSRK